MWKKYIYAVYWIRQLNFNQVFCFFFEMGNFLVWNINWYCVGWLDAWGRINLSFLLHVKTKEDNVQIIMKKSTCENFMGLCIFGWKWSCKVYCSYRLRYTFFEFPFHFICDLLGHQNKRNLLLLKNTLKDKICLSLYRIFIVFDSIECH